MFACYNPKVSLSRLQMTSDMFCCNSRRLEGHHFASPFAPYLPGGGKQWIQTGDPAQIVGFSTERGFSGAGKGPTIFLVEENSGFRQENLHK